MHRNIKILNHTPKTIGTRSPNLNNKKIPRRSATNRGMEIGSSAERKIKLGKKRGNIELTLKHWTALSRTLHWENRRVKIDGELLLLNNLRFCCCHILMHRNTIRIIHQILQELSDESRQIKGLQIDEHRKDKGYCC